MQSLEEIITTILAQKPDLTRESILKMMHSKREGAGRLLTDEGAAHMVASDLGVSLTSSGTFKTTLDSKNLIIGSSDVSVTGRVAMAYPTRTFQKRDGAQGRVGRFVLQDEKGFIKIVLWDEKAELIDQNRLIPGVIARVNHGYVRAGLDGRPEVNVGNRGSIVIESSSPESEQRQIESHKKIGDVSEKDFFVNIIGIVISASSPSAFTRSDGTSGRVARIQVGDETGQIRLVLWNEKAEFSEGLDKDVAVEVLNGRIRRGLTGEVEVHVSQSSEVKKLEEPPKGVGAPKLMLRKVHDLVPGLMSVDVLARVAVLGQVRIFQRQVGGDGKVADATLIDATGSVRLSLWDEQADVFKKLVSGDVVLLKGAYTREGLGGSISLNMGKMGSIVVNPEINGVKDLPEYSKDGTPIGELQAGFPASVEGEIAETPSEKQITTKDGRELKLVSLRLRDSSGEIGVSLWNENAEKARNLIAGNRLRIRDAFVRIGYDGDLELSTRSATKIEVLAGETEGYGPIGDDGHGFADGEYYESEAQLIAASTCEVEDLCPNCGSQVHKLDGQLICNECGRLTDVNHRLVLEAEMETEGKKFTAVFKGDDAESLLGMKEDNVRNLISQSLDENASIELARRKLRSQRLRIKGTIAGSSSANFKVLVSRFEQLRG